MKKSAEVDIFGWTPITSPDCVSLIDCVSAVKNSATAEKNVFGWAQLTSPECVSAVKNSAEVDIFG